MGLPLLDFNPFIITVYIRLVLAGQLPKEGILEARMLQLLTAVQQVAERSEKVITPPI